jgi:plasmid replication initiation protein
MKNKNLTVYKANQIVEASYRLTLNEQRVVLACIAQVKSKEALLTKDEFEVAAKDFAGVFSVSEDRAYHALAEVAESLFNRYVVIDNPDASRPKVKRLKMRWISSIEYLPDDGKIAVCFSKKILPYLSELRGGFTKYKLEHIGKMTSVYAIRLYELLMQWNGVGKREIEIAWLKQRFQIEDLYPDMHNFKKRVLNPAVDDINTHSNLTVSWTQRKTGRRVTHLIFTFGAKPGAASGPKSTQRNKTTAADGDWQDYLKKHARPGETWEQAGLRLRPQFEAEIQRAKA